MSGLADSRVACMCSCWFTSGRQPSRGDGLRGCVGRTTTRTSCMWSRTCRPSRRSFRDSTSRSSKVGHCSRLCSVCSPAAALHLAPRHMLATRQPARAVGSANFALALLGAQMTSRLPRSRRCRTTWPPPLGSPHTTPASLMPSVSAPASRAFAASAAAGPACCTAAALILASPAPSAALHSSHRYSPLLLPPPRRLPPVLLQLAVSWVAHSCARGCVCVSPPLFVEVPRVARLSRSARARDRTGCGDLLQRLVQQPGCVGCSPITANHCMWCSHRRDAGRSWGTQEPAVPKPAVMNAAGSKGAKGATARKRLLPGGVPKFLETGIWQVILVNNYRLSITMCEHSLLVCCAVLRHEWAHMRLRVAPEPANRHCFGTRSCGIAEFHAVRMVPVLKVRQSAVLGLVLEDRPGPNHRQVRLPRWCACRPDPWLPTRPIRAHTGAGGTPTTTHLRPVVQLFVEDTAERLSEICSFASAPAVSSFKTCAQAVSSRLLQDTHSESRVFSAAV